MNTLLANGLSLLLQSTLLLGLGLFAARCLRRRGPILQSAILRAALTSVALAALFSAIIAGHVRPLWRVALPAQTISAPVQTMTPPAPAEDPPAPSSGGAGIEHASPLVPPELGVRGLSSAVPPLSRARVPVPVLYSLLIGVWGMGTLGLLVWLLACHVHVSRLRRRSIPIADGPAAETLGELCAAQNLSLPRLLAGGDVQSPFLTGLRRPAIVLPASYATDFTPDALRAILSHELAHLERRDCAWTLLARLTCAAFWMQPLLWLACRRMEHAAEEACDQAVLARHADSRAYADCLLSLAERLTPSRLERAVGAGVVPFRSSLGRRIQHILERTQVMPALSLPTRVALALAAVSAAALLPLFAAPTLPIPAIPEPQTTPLVGLAVVLHNDTAVHAAPDLASPVRHIYRKGDFVSVGGQRGTEYILNEPGRSSTYVAQADVRLLSDQQVALDQKISLDDNTVSFLDKQISETRQKMRRAEQALLNLKRKPSPMTASEKRTLTQLTRNYALQADLYNELMKQRAQTKLKADIDKLNLQSDLFGAPLSPAASSIVGTWRYPTGKDTKSDYDYVTFRADGSFQVDSTHGIPHVYGVYSVTGDKLTITIQRNQWANGVTKAEKSPKPHLARLTLTADKLTIIPSDSHTIIADRVTTVGATPSVAPSEAKADDSLAQARFMAGLTAVQGPGVVVTLNDSKKPFPTGLAPGFVPPNIIHDIDINQVVNELKAAGAEAIAVNDQRLVATSPIRCAGPTVYVNNTPQTPPYVIKAIGDPKTLEYIINRPGGVIAQIRQFDPAMSKSVTAEHLVLPAYTGTGQPRYAKPTALEPSSTENSIALTTLTAQRDELAAENDRLNEQIKALSLRLKTGEPLAESKRYEQQRSAMAALQAEIVDRTIILQTLQLSEKPQHPDMIAAKVRLGALQARVVRLKAVQDSEFAKHHQWADLRAERQQFIKVARDNQIILNALNARIGVLRQANPKQ